jgi:formylglycine-generating enzyme required for sulfatase activity
MGIFAGFVRSSRDAGSRGLPRSGLCAIAAITACVVLTVAAHAQGDIGAKSAQHELEARIASLKTETAALVASARQKAASQQQNLTAPPIIFRVPDALTEFRDCAGCPQMVVIPAGEFTMGAPASEQGAGSETQHRVTIAAPFAVSKFEVSFDEWDTCVAEGGCGGYRPDDEGWGRGTSPVMNISWDDAKAYADWLGRKTGQAYRLLSESEWEYAARAGTTTSYPYEDGISPSKANYDGSGDGAGPSDVNRQRTVTIGSFPANGFGLHDMNGNVSEWVEDCWHDGYTAMTPADGSVWRDGDCKGHVVRGGSWEDSEVELRSAARTGGAKEDRFYTDGIRIARSL